MSYRALWQTLHDSTRLRILALLEEEELSVAELQEILHLGQSRISTHLAHLRRVGMVQPRREGKRTYRSEERRVGKECRSRCDWSSDVCSSDLVAGNSTSRPVAHLDPPRPSAPGRDGPAAPRGQAHL